MATTHKCECAYCAGANFKPILQRINGDCDCFLCERKRRLPFIYYDCVELHFQYQIGFNRIDQKLIQELREKIKYIKKEYKRKKTLFLWYLRAVTKLMRLYTHVQYKPGGSQYLILEERFYKMVADRKKIKEEIDF